MTTEAAPARVAGRKKLRLGCVFRLGDEELVGHTATIAPTSLHVRTPHLDAVEGVTEHAQFTFRLLSDPPIEGTGLLAWSEQEIDERGQRLLGLELTITDASVQRALERVLQHDRPTVLVVDPDPLVGEEASRWLASQHQVVTAESIAAAQSAIARQEPIAVVASASFGEQLAAVWAKTQPQVARLLTFANEFELQKSPSLDNVAACLKKPLRSSDFVTAVRRAADAALLHVENERLSAELERRHDRLRRENVYLKRKLSGVGFSGIIGKSAALQKLLGELEAVRLSDTTVHISGETGTGKELIARALHQSGNRAQGPFVPQSCAGIAESLLQSTLFGHRKGAFTGATRDHAGVFEQAHKGTLFLDEVSELSPPLQASLLRALQESEVTPLGARTPVKVDVRIISASSADLKALVTENRFREDLFFRLVVFAIALPPLRAREEDIDLLAEHFLSLQCQRHGKGLAGFEPAAMSALRRYAWPGNVRELENEIERVVVLAEDRATVSQDLLSPSIREAAGSEAVVSGPYVTLPDSIGYDEAIDELSRRLLAEALERHAGSVTEAARALGMDRSRLGKLRRRLGLSGDAE